MAELLPDKLKFKRAPEGIETLRELKYRLIINSISATRNLKHAALEVGVTHMTMLQFCKNRKIGKQQQDIMRGYFKSLDVKVKYKYHPNYEEIIDNCAC